MSSEEFKNLPYALRLAKMGRQKVSRGEHNKRTEEIKTLINKKYHKSHPYQQHEWYPQHVHGHHNGSAVVPYHNNVVLDIIHAAGMDETYGTYVGDECFDIHD